MEKSKVVEELGNGKKKENKYSPTKGLTFQYEEHSQHAQETPKQLRSYKRKITEQNFSHKVNT